MDHLDAFCKKRELKINVEKTDIQQAQKVPTFNMGNLTIESDTQYKYLGIIYSANCALKPAVTTLANQTNKALFTLMHARSC